MEMRLQCVTFSCVYPSKMVRLLFFGSKMPLKRAFVSNVCLISPYLYLT